MKSPIPETGSRRGLAKLTVRPAEGHEVKLGTIFQEDLYSVGQPPRRAGDPNSTNPAGPTACGGTSIYKSDVKNYTTTLGWKYSKPTTSCSTGTPRFTGIAPKTTRSRPRTQARPKRRVLRSRRIRQSGLRLHRRHPRLSARHLRYRRPQHVAFRNRGFLASCGHLWPGCIPGRGDDKRPARNIRRHHPGRHAHRFRWFRAVEGQLHLDARGGRRAAL